jgi:hypothetical protein
MIDTDNIEEKAFWDLLKLLETKADGRCIENLKSQFEMCDAFWGQLWQVLDHLGYDIVKCEKTEDTKSLLSSPDVRHEIETHETLAEWLSLQFYFYNFDRSWCSPVTHDVCDKINGLLVDDKWNVIIQKLIIDKNAA